MVCPATPYDAKGLLKAAIRDDDPVIFLESEGLYAKKGPVGGPDELVPLGRAAVRRRGDDCTVVAISRMVWIALSAADALAEGGHRVRRDRPAHAAPARPGDHRGQRPAHRARGDRGGGLARVRRGGQPRRRGSTRRASTGSTRPIERVSVRRRAHALREEPRAVRPALARRRHRRGAAPRGHEGKA